MLKPSMINYIRDQGEALKATYENKNTFCLPFVETIKQNDIKKIYFLGSGTSYNASLAAKYYFEKYLNVEVEALIPTYFTNYERVNNNRLYSSNQILIVGITQSGTSASTINALKQAREKGYTTIAITEALDSPVTLVTDKVIKLTCGKELIPVETRGYSVSVFEMYLIALEVSKEMSLLQLAIYDSLRKKIESFLKQYESILNYIEDWYEENKYELVSFTKGCIAGYGINACTCAEAELKLYETYKKPFSHYDIEEMIHGPQMAFDEETYIFIIAGPGKELENLSKFCKWFDDNEVTNHVFIISSLDAKHSDKDCLIKYEIDDDLTPLVYILPFQIIAARNCIAAGIDTSVRPPKRKSFAHIY